MASQAQGPLVIHSRRGAAIALCLGILLTLRNLRYLFEVYIPGHTWLTRYHFPPNSFDRILHLWCSVLFIGGLIFILRRTRGGERVYLAIFVGVAILAPLSDISWAASNHIYTWIATVLELGLIPSAISILKTIQPHPTELETQT